MVTAASLIFAACQNNSNKNKNSDQQVAQAVVMKEVRDSAVPYTIAQRYFVKSSVKKIDPPKIETAADFDKIFGPAATMGKDGKPTPVDFTKQYVIALMLPETDTNTFIKPLSLVKNDSGNIILNYEIDKGIKQTFTMVPALALIVDKDNNGAVILKEQK